jgi:predicted adenine nucleotide alpha hydrolase (AANH) superfamily ATPase
LKVLFHVCCGPCFTAVGEALREEGHAVTAFFYNPNIQPYKEFEARLAAFEEVCKAQGFPTIVDLTYEPERWMAGALEVDDRCEHCYRDRLSTAARRAREEGQDAFTSTLLASPYQKHELARVIGDEVSASEGVEFLYLDLREYWKESRRRTFELGIYRQGYCGCIFSERDRYMGEPGHRQ